MATPSLKTNSWGTDPSYQYAAQKLPSLPGFVAFCLCEVLPVFIPSFHPSSYIPFACNEECLAAQLSQVMEMAATVLDP